MTIVSWYHSLPFKERIVLGAGIAIVIASMLYVMLWKPMQERVNMLHAAVDVQEQQLGWMEVTARELELLREELKSMLPADSDGNRPLLTEVDIDFIMIPGGKIPGGGGGMP